MLNSCYEIEQDGIKYFGNVLLKEFYQFQRNGKYYLFNVETMTPYQITDSIACLVEKTGAFLGGELILERDMEELNKLDILAANNYLSPLVPFESVMDKMKITDDETTSQYTVKSIAIFVAQECNMACAYCYGQGGEYADKGMMEASTALRAVDWLMKNSVGIESVRISFFGGEPMMNFSLIKKVVDYAKQEATKCGKTVSFSITTNGSIISDKIIAFLQEEKIHPLISFDGSPEIQNRQRPFKNGRDSYEKTYLNIQKLKKAFPQLAARATLYGDTDPVEVSTGLKQAGFNKFSIRKASPVILDNSVMKDASDMKQDQINERMIVLESRLANELSRCA